MKTISFTYTKDSGVQSERTLVVSSEPDKFVSGTDISELEPVEMAEYVEGLTALRNMYLEAVKELNDVYDLNRSFRRFKPEGMTNITEFKT